MRILSISEAAAATGVSTDTLRRYSDKGLITPVKDGAGRRYFFAHQLDEIREQKRQMRDRRERLRRDRRQKGGKDA